MNGLIEDRDRLRRDYAPEHLARYLRNLNIDAEVVEQSMVFAPKKERVSFAGLFLTSSPGGAPNQFSMSLVA